MKTYNKSIIKKEEVERELSLYFEGMRTRIELSQWGNRKIKQQKDSDHYVVTIDDHIVKQAFLAICSSTIKDNCFEKQGLPYFIRDYDLKEWLLSIKRQDIDFNLHCKIGQLRPHQMRNIQEEQYISINIDPLILFERLKIDHIRGVDDLDFFQEFNIRIGQDVQVRLVRYMRSPEPNAFIFYSNKKNPVNEINDLLSEVGLKLSDAIWINPTFITKY